MTTEEKNISRLKRWHRLALLAPFVWQLALAGMVNGVHWSPLGVPFPMVWQMSGVLVATVAIGFVFWRDEVHAKRTAAAELAP